MREHTNRPLLMKELMRELGVPREERHELKRVVRELRADGEIVKIRGNRYGLPDRMNLVVGKLSAHPDGYGFVVPEKEGEPDVFIGRRGLKGAMHGDRVVARIESTSAPGRSEGSVIRILERGFSTLVGRFESGRGYSVVVPNNPRITHEFYVDPKDRGGASPGDIVIAEVVRYPEAYGSAAAKVKRVLGSPDAPGMDTDMVIAEHGLATKFSQAAVNEARNTPQTVTPSMRRGRRDLRGILTVTIDGETARDFDDAVSAERLDDGLIRLYVSIADVSHYVRPKSALDADAVERATSVYFPDRVLPMLPEELSNGICSLNPGVERLAMTAEMVFNSKGERVSYELYGSVIKSDARLTYTDTAAVIEREDESVISRWPHISQMLFVMRELMDSLNGMRARRGSIDFDLPEPEVVIDLQGKTTDIIRSPRNRAHRLIEEFMLAANETVAFHLESHGVPFLYRIHEEPDEEKMAELGGLVRELGVAWPSVANIRPKHIARVLKSIEGRPEERFINSLMLRSMKQARYSPDNAGHFGLASRCYCHFTSPIRRYPDLAVHRALKELIKSGEISAERKSAMAAGLATLGRHTSDMERLAEDAERQVVEIKKLKFMLDKVGAEFPGYISGVTAFGFFVELQEYFVEGLVRLTSLYDDYYSYEEKRHLLVGRRTGRTYRLGDEVTVVVDRVDLERRQLDFTLPGGPREAGEDRLRGAPVWVKHKEKTKPAGRPGRQSSKKSPPRKGGRGRRRGR
jgi:ribonuclease R